MLYISCPIITVIYSILVCVFGSIYCPFSLRNPKHVTTFGHVFDCFAPLFGLKVECRKPVDVESYGNAIYIVNHQNSYDTMTTSNIVQSPTVTVGKESLLWIPFFGRLYWLAGNLLIDRSNRTRAHGTIAEVMNHFKKHRIPTWMFSEGTHSRGRDLLSLKTGAFHVAIAAGVPTIPVCVFTTSNKINLNRLHNGLVIVEMLPLIDISRHGKDQVRELVAHYRSTMEQRIAELDEEVAGREATGKV